MIKNINLVKLTITQTVVEDVRDKENQILHKAGAIYAQEQRIIKGSDIDYFTKPQLLYVQDEAHNKAIPFLVEYTHKLDLLTPTEIAMVESYLKKHIQNKG